MLIYIHNEISISQRPDGYINLTQMAAAIGKHLDNWLRSQETIDLLEAFSTQQISISNPQKFGALEMQPPVITKRSRHGSYTWAHPLIAIQFAQHCSPIFALQVSQWVIDFMSGKSPNQPQIGHPKQQRSRARSLILKALNNHLATSQSPPTQAYRQFVDQYNQKQIALPDWVYTARPHLSRASLYNWQNLVKSKGHSALIDNYKGKVSKA